MEPNSSQESQQPQQIAPLIQTQFQKRQPNPSQSGQVFQSDPSTVLKAAIDLQAGDMLVGRNGGLSLIEDSSDHSGHLGLMRVETEHGHLYLEIDVEVKVLAPPVTKPDK